MASIAHLLRGRDSEFFDLFDRAGANVVRAAVGVVDDVVERPDDETPLDVNDL